MKDVIYRDYCEQEYNSLYRFLNYAEKCEAFGKELQKTAALLKKKINGAYFFIKSENELKIRIGWFIEELDELAYLHTVFLTLMDFQQQEDPENYFETIIKQYKNAN